MFRRSCATAVLAVLSTLLPTGCSLVTPMPLWELVKGAGAAASITVGEQDGEASNTVYREHAPFSELCIEFNPAAEVEDLIPTLQLELRAHKVESRVYEPLQKISSCQLWLRYRASIAWGLPPLGNSYRPYVTDAALTLQAADGPVISTSQYVLEDGVRTSKWASTRAKLAPVVTALLTGVENTDKCLDKPPLPWKEEAMNPPVASAECRLRAAHPLLWLALAAGPLAGCATPQDEPAVARPLIASPVPRPPGIERVATGGIFQPGSQMGLAFMNRAKPRRIGDTLKVDISESLSASNKVNTDNSRANAVASKGPGTSETGIGILKGILNLDATASGSDSFKGAGSTDNTASFTGTMAATVINVYPNGNLLVAGERSIALNGGQTTLRFSGIVDPRDLKDGNIVASADVVNARLEVAGRGDVSDAASRSWLQRVLTGTLQVW